MGEHTYNAFVHTLVMLWNAFIILGITYLVGWQDWSGWWYLMLFILTVNSKNRSEA